MRCASLKAVLTFVVTLVVLTSSAQAQDREAKPPAKDTIAGKWQTTRNMTSGGTRHIILELRQEGDSLWGLASVEIDGMPTETNVDIAGTIKNATVALKSPWGNLKLEGKLRKNDMRLWITPGRYQDGSKYEMSFQRIP
jgi:hypothetical protein